MTWIALAREKTAPQVAAQMMNCDVRQARRRLEEAADQAACASRRFHARQQNVRDAVEVLLADNVVRQEINPRSWEDIALGLKGAA